MIELDRDGHEWMEAGSHAADPDGVDSLADEELLRRYRNTREANALTALVHRHRPMVRRTCMRLAGNLHDADDATQSVFLVLAERPEMVRRSLAGCLHGLARAAVSEIRRSRRRQAQREAVAAGIRSVFNRLSGGRPVGHEELREELDAALAQLPDDLHQAVILRYLEGLSQEEAAKRAGCTTTTMGWRSMKGLGRLRTALSRRGVVATPAAVLAVLAAEAGSASAREFAAAATGPASAAAVRVAAALAKQGTLGSTVLKVGLALLLTSGVVAGAVMIANPPAPDAATVPSHHARVPAAKQDRPLVLGLFDRSLDIGGPARSGSAQLAGDTYTVRGGGTHIYGMTDQFRFVYRPWTGNGEIIARIHSDPNQEARQVCAGVMFRESLAADSHHATFLLDALGKAEVKWRDDANPASACDLSGGNQPGKHWVRLVRRGNTFTAYTRPDEDETWRQIKELDLPMKSSLYVGLAVTAHDDAQLATTTIDRVSLQSR